MADAVRNVTSARPHDAHSFLVTLACGHQVLCPAARVRGTLLSVRAPLTALCNQCPKDTPHG